MRHHISTTILTFSHLVFLSLVAGIPAALYGASSPVTHASVSLLFVDQSAGSDIYDGTSPTHPVFPSNNSIGPKKTIQAALNNLPSSVDCIVNVAPGMYSESSYLCFSSTCLGKSVTIQTLTGERDVSIDSSGAYCLGIEAGMSTGTIILRNLTIAISKPSGLIYWSSPDANLHIENTTLENTTTNTTSICINCVWTNGPCSRTLTVEGGALRAISYSRAYCVYADHLAYATFDNCQLTIDGSHYSMIYRLIRGNAVVDMHDCVLNGHGPEDSSVISLTVHKGTARGGDVSSIQLASTASATNDIYNDWVIYIVSGKGAGQLRLITDYIGSSSTQDRIAILSSEWNDMPDETSVYHIIPANAKCSQIKIRNCTGSIGMLAQIESGISILEITDNSMTLPIDNRSPLGLGLEVDETPAMLTTNGFPFEHILIANNDFVLTGASVTHDLFLGMGTDGSIISGNHILRTSSTTAYGFVIKSNDNTIRYNVVESGPAALYVSGGSRNLITNNTFRSNLGTTGQIGVNQDYLYGPPAGHAIDNTITHNTFISTNGLAFLVVTGYSFPPPRPTYTWNNPTFPI